MGLYEDWSKAILFLLRKHWLKFDRTRRRHVPDTDVPPWRQQPVNPLVFAVYRSAISKLIKQRPTLEVVAPSSDSEDMESAKLGQSLLEHFHTKLKMTARDKRLIAWLLSTGNAYARIFWDTDGGEVIAHTVPVEVQDPETGEVSEVDCPCDEEGNPILTSEGAPDLEAEPIMQKEGEIGYHVENALSVRFNPEAESVDDATEFFIARVWPKAYAAEQFDVPESELDCTTDDELVEYFDLHSAAASGADDVLGVGLGVGQADAKGDRVLVLEYYAKPDPSLGYPEGRHWIQVGKTPVTEEEPLPEGFWPPIVPMQDTPIPGQPHAIGLLPQCVPINEKYNYLDGKILEYHVTMAMGGIWFVHPADKGMVITSDPAQVKVSKGLAEGFPPVQAKMNALPDPVYEERNRLLEMLQYVAGTNDIGLGQEPAGVSSGRGFLVLQEVVDSLLTPTLIAFEEAKQEMGRRMLVLAQRHYKEERTIRVKGEQGQWMIRSFKGADLVEGLDVRVQVGSSFPWSKSAKMDTALSILEKLPQLASDPETGLPDMAKVQRFLDVGGVGVFQSEGDPDSLEIDREHAMFESFDPDKGSMALPQIGFWQNHARHLERHYSFVKTSYMRITRWHPAAQQAFLDHMLQTAQAVQQMVASITPMPGAEGEDSTGADGGAGVTSPAKKQGSGKDLKLTRGDRAAAGV